MKTTTLKKDFRLIFIAGFFLLAASVYAAIGLPWGPDEKKENGFLVMAGTSKDITVYSECKKVTAPSGKNVYVPTGRATEWSAFKAGAGNVGATLGPCSALPSCNNNGVRDNGEAGVDCGGGNCGACAASPVCGNGVQEAGESCDNGGANSNGIPGACKTDCSGTVPNPSCTPNGSYTYGSCSEACGNFGVREQYDSCGDLVTNSDPCNRFSCPSSCTPTGWTQTSAPTCLSEGEQSRTLSDCTTVTQPIPQLSGLSCPTGIWTKGSCIPKSGQTCGAGNGTQSYTCAGGNGYCSGSQPANEDCDLAVCAAQWSCYTDRRDIGNYCELTITPAEIANIISSNLALNGTSCSPVGNEFFQPAERACITMGDINGVTCVCN